MYEQLITMSNKKKKLPRYVKIMVYQMVLFSFKSLFIYLKKQKDTVIQNNNGQ